MASLPNVCNGSKRGWNAWKRAVPEHQSQLGQSGDLEVGLNLVERLAMGGVANAKAVVGQSAIFILVGGDVNVAIIEVVVRIVPVAVE